MTAGQPAEAGCPSGPRADVEAFGSNIEGYVNKGILIEISSIDCFGSSEMTF